MAHIKTKARYEDVQQFVIYVLLSPIDLRFYVGRTRKHSVHNHYKDHRILRNQSTKQLFLEAKEHGVVPQMYRLEELETVEADADRHCAAWRKYFLKQGYQSIIIGKATNGINELSKESKTVYDRISERELNAIICEENLLEPKAQSRTKENKTKRAPAGTTAITFRVTEKDAEKIQKAAEKKNWNVSEYCRAAAIDGCVVHVDFSPLIQYTRQIAGMKDMLGKLIETIGETGTYYPQDLENIQKMTDTVGVHAEKIRQDMTNILRKAQKEISAAKRELR